MTYFLLWLYNWFPLICASLIGLLFLGLCLLGFVSSPHKTNKEASPWERHR